MTYTLGLNTLGLLITIIRYTLVIKETKKIFQGMLNQLDFNVYKLLWYPAAALFVTFISSIAYNVIEYLYILTISFPVTLIAYDFMSPGS